MAKLVAVIEVPNETIDGANPSTKTMKALVRNAVGNLLDETYDGTKDYYSVVVSVERHFV